MPEKGGCLFHPHLFPMLTRGFSAFAMMEPERTRSAQTLLLQLSETNPRKSCPLFSPAR